MKLKEITIGAVLTAMAIIIPIQFGFLRIIAGPFTATLASHVPMFVAMVINPTVAVMVGAGSTIGFLLTAPAVVAARAASHIVVGLVGAILIKRGKPMLATFAVAAPIHAALEALAVIPFGWTAYSVLVVTGVGTLIHHMVDAAIATSVIYLLNPLKKTGLVKR